jgi:hypothetical protein
VSDCEGRGPSRIWLGRISRKNVLARRRADRVRVAYGSLRQGRQVRWNKRHSLSGEAAKRTLITAMAGRRMIGRSLVVADLDAELGGFAEERLKLGGERRIIRAGECGRGHGGGRRCGEKLNNKREGDDNGRNRRPERRRAASCTPVPRRKFSAAETHQNIPPVPLMGNRTGGGTQLQVRRGQRRPAPSQLASA